MSTDPQYDALIIGGGPAGATAGLVLAREGWRVLLLERSAFPRFHIGESFLPRNMALIRELGLEPELRKIPQVEKRGAEFLMGHGKDEGTLYWFTDILTGGETVSFNIERAPFDAMLLDSARKAGVEVREQSAVKKIVRLEDGRVEAVTDAGEEISARYLVDASGQSTLVGKHLNIRKVLPHRRKVAYFGHFENVARRPGVEGGFIVIVMTEEGWFWLIPLDETRMSIGVVMHADQAKKVGLPPEQMLPWAIERCPAVKERMANAVYPESSTGYHVLADFSYRCSPYAGLGYFLVGDAAVFIDPIFSTGVCMGMMSATEAARGISALLRGTSSPAKVRRRYIRFVGGSSSALFGLIDRYYRHSFRELFLSGAGPLKVYEATMALLAGYVFPRPPFAVRWRVKLLDFFAFVNRFVPIAQRRERFSLLK
ncbi:MAG TPA: NAD(P)/FAD-dependent oxidoreductase [Thermoanaerobaculia bacterium]|nr:NAD(P)/FAD-dependent oxidoreductase [Thermoanaerobaculia bacterium]